MAAKKTAKTADGDVNPETKVSTVKVEAVKRLGEAGEVYNPGDVFETTPKRAKALGELVKPASE